MSLQGDTEPSRGEEAGATQVIGDGERSTAGAAPGRGGSHAEAKQQENNVAGTEAEEGNGAG